MKKNLYTRLTNISGDFIEIQELLKNYKKKFKKQFLLKVGKNTLSDNSNASKEIKKRIKLYKSWGYNNFNTVFFQIFDNYFQDTHKKLSELFKLKKSVSSVIIQEPGNILPYHRDTFINFKLKNNLNPKNNSVVRYMIFLEDRKQGHYFEVENKIINEWRKGDVIYWGNNYHMGANSGSVLKATLNITGISDKHSLHKKKKKIKKLNF